MKKCIAYLLTLALVFTGCLSCGPALVSANAQHVSYYIDDNGMVNLYVDFENAYGNVMLTVFDFQSYNPETFSSLDDEAKAECIKFIKQQKLNNSSCEFTFAINGISGYYPYQAALENGNRIITGKIAYVASGDTSVIDTINLKADASDLRLYLNENTELVFGNSKYYSNSTDDEKLIICADIISSSPYEKLSDVAEMAQKSRLIMDINTADAENLSAILTAYGKLLGLKTCPEYDIFSKADEAFKNSVATKMQGSSFEFPTNFYEAVNLVCIKNTKNYTEIKPILTRLKASAKANLNNYFALGSTKAVDTALVGGNYADLKALESKINYEIENIDKGGSGGVGGSSGGGSGTSSGGGAPDTVVVPSTVNDKTDMFKDLGGFDWAKPAIEVLAQNGIINGKENGTFAPQDTVSRDELVKMLTCVFEIYDKNAKSVFADLNNHWSQAYIASAEKYGLVKGITKNSFGAGQPVTREDMAVLCYRFMLAFSVEMQTGENTEFADADIISDYAKEAVQVLKGAGVINGKDNNEFAPKDVCTRAEAAKVVYFIYAVKNK